MLGAGYTVLKKMDTVIFTELILLTRGVTDTNQQTKITTMMCFEGKLLLGETMFVGGELF